MIPKKEPFIKFKDVGKTLEIGGDDNRNFIVVGITAVFAIYAKITGDTTPLAIFVGIIALIFM
ncbi:MAG: hypothetical protein GOV01_02910, partial [Candidatus Altiarchaeota archaeon]|nr:hypothetical protein [Candidatus Altiarchaeota archaeon]